MSEMCYLHVARNYISEAYRRTKLLFYLHFVLKGMRDKIFLYDYK